jgi:hypothetical protein
MTTQVLPKQSTIFLPELFEHLKKRETREEKIQTLQAFIKLGKPQFELMRAFVELNWHPSVKFGLPEGNPPYTHAGEIETDAPASLYKVFKEIGRFLEGSSQYITNPLKREFYFISKLESLALKEGKLLVLLKDRLVFKQYPDVEFELFNEAYKDYNFIPQESYQIVIEDEANRKKS